MDDYREFPIVRRVLPHTGRLDGDDTGYRHVPVTPLDAAEPDPLVPINDVVACYPVYAHGRRHRITPFYDKGLGAAPTVLMRAPAARALERADEILKIYRRRLLVLDGWRSAKVQARLFTDIFHRVASNRSLEGLTIGRFIQLGRLADDTASFCQVAVGSDLEQVMDRMLRDRQDEVVEAATQLELTPEQLATEAITYQANLGIADVPLDRTANTAHGSGGAADLWLIDLTTEQPVNLGVPFDSTSPAACMDFFERSTFEEYRELVLRDAALREYLGDLGLPAGEPTAEAFDIARTERRVLFHSLRAVGASFYSLDAERGEPWHYNLGNLEGGRQAAIYPEAGNACHSLLKAVRDPNSGSWIANWGNESAHRLADSLLGDPSD